MISYYDYIIGIYLHFLGAVLFKISNYLYDVQVRRKIFYNERLNQ